MKTFYHLNKKYKKDLNEHLVDNDREELFKGTFKEISEILKENDNNYNIISQPTANQIRNLEKKIKELEMKIQNLKNIEIKRIFKEYIDNDYENKYLASIDVVLGALFGEYSRNIQVNNFKVFKKGYFDEIKNIRFYEFTKRNGWIV